MTVLWMGVIFFFSAQNGEHSSGVSDGVMAQIVRFFIPGFAQMNEIKQQSVLETGTFLIRKTAHFSEYAVLGMLLYNLIKTWNWRWQGIAAWGIAIVYAVSDEFHQMFSDGRTPKITDVAIDACGAATGILLCVLVGVLIRKRRQE